jgi:3-phosphoshikimate 1-carboxyvinyltransferase
MGSGSDAVSGESDLLVEGRGGSFAVPAGPLDVGGSGTAMRFLTALAAIAPGDVVVDGDARMRERPMRPLLDALRDVGVEALSLAANGCPPVRVRGGTLEGGTVRLPGDVSSQFVSALLMIAPFAPRGVVVEVSPPVVSRPYIDLTLTSMERFGCAPPEPEALGDGSLRFRFASRDAGAAPYRAAAYRVPPDASSAAYFLGAAAVTGGRVTIPGMDPSDGQADARLVRILPELGCEVEVSPEGTTVHGRATRGEGGRPPRLEAAAPAGSASAPESTRAAGGLAAFDLDMSDAPDLVPMLAVLALFADGPCVIRGAANLRLKESDRLHALANEIAHVGGQAEERPDGLRIVPRPLHAGTIETYNDHRIAMAFAIAGLGIPGGLTITNPACVAKSFPGFWSSLARLCA